MLNLLVCREGREVRYQHMYIRLSNMTFLVKRPLRHRVSVGLLATSFLLASCVSNRGDKPAGEGTVGLWDIAYSTPLADRPEAPDERVGSTDDTRDTDGTRSPARATARRIVPSVGRIDPASSDPGRAYPEFPNGRELNVTVTSRSVPEFINAVFGDLLELAFIIGPEIEKIDHHVAIRSVQSMSENELFDLAVNALEDYGVGVYYEDNVLHFVEYAELRRTIPRFIKARARATVPTGLRPVVQYVQLVSAGSGDIYAALKEAFPDNNVLSIKQGAGTNSITLGGMPNQVNAALDIINVLDVPYFAGVTVETFRPANWTAVDLVKQLNDQLLVEGFSVSTVSLINRTINLLAIPHTNQVAIYTQDPGLRAYILESARELDRAAEPVSETRRTHVYRAQFYDVQELAGILDSVVSAMNIGGAEAGGAGEQGGGVPSQSLPGRVRTGVVNLPGGDAGPSASIELTSGRIVVDTQGNRLIFFGTNEEYQAISDLLVEIDQPGDEVLLEVTIAEVSINEETTQGIEFLFQQIGANSVDSLGTLGALGLSGGLSGIFQTGDFDINFAFGASNNQINVLSEPRIVTKSGAEASIQVGTEVPVISTQTAADVQAGGSNDILQSVEYRSTGILLDIAPIVFSDNRIDLTISQEVSAALPNENPAIASPVFSNRLIVTEMSLEDGQTAIMGGLIEKRFIRGQTGVPFLKDLPVIGQAFRSETLTSDQTVLIVTITPYVLNDRGDRQRAQETLRRQVNKALQTNVNERATTLRGPRGRFSVEGTGNPEDEPEPERVGETDDEPPAT